MKKQILLNLLIWTLHTIFWSQDYSLEINPTINQELRNTELIECEISYARANRHGELRPYRLEIYNKERDELIIKRNEKISATINWKENDSNDLKYTYAYYERNNFHILESKSKDRRFTKYRFLPLKNGRIDYSVMSEELDEMFAQDPIDIPIDINEIKKLIPLEHIEEDSLIYLDIGAIDSLKNHKRIITGRYRYSKKDPANKNNSIYGISELKIKSFELEEGYVEYLFEYYKNRNRFYIKSKKTFDKHHNLVISYSLDAAVSDTVYSLKYSYDENGNWTKMEAYLNNSVIRTTKRYFVYEEK